MLVKRDGALESEWDRKIQQLALGIDTETLSFEAAERFRRELKYARRVHFEEKGVNISPLIRWANEGCQAVDPWG